MAEVVMKDKGGEKSEAETETREALFDNQEDCRPDSEIRLHHFNQLETVSKLV
jgi:hypothetical protein